MLFRILFLSNILSSRFLSFFEVIVIVIALSKWPIWLSSYRLSHRSRRPRKRLSDYRYRSRGQLVPTTAKNILHFAIHETGDVREADIYVHNWYQAWHVNNHIYLSEYWLKCMTVFKGLEVTRYAKRSPQIRGALRGLPFQRRAKKCTNWELG